HVPQKTKTSPVVHSSHRKRRQNSFTSLHIREAGQDVNANKGRAQTNVPKNRIQWRASLKQRKLKLRKQRFRSSSDSSKNVRTCEISISWTGGKTTVATMSMPPSRGT